MNSHRHSAISSKAGESANMCAICQCEMESASKATLNSCIHSYCFDCIKQWASKENKCPLCKKRFNIINYKDEDGVKKQFQAENKN